MAIPAGAYFGCGIWDGDASSVLCHNQRIGTKKSNKTALPLYSNCLRKIEAKHPPLKPLKSRIRNFQRAGEGEVWGVFRRSLARLLAKKKEETEEDVHKFKEDWGNIDKEAWQVPLGGA